VCSQYGVGSTFFFDLDLIFNEPANSAISENSEIRVLTTLEPFVSPKSTPNTDNLLWPSDDASLSTLGNEFSPKASFPQTMKFHRTLIVDDSQVNRKLMKKLLVNHFDIVDEVCFFQIKIIIIILSFPRLKMV
jgi:hypothetical protein